MLYTLRKKIPLFSLQKGNTIFNWVTNEKCTFKCDIIMGNS